MNRYDRRHGAPDLRGAHILQPPADPRFERVKVVPLGLPALVHLMTMDGTYGLRMEGWPEDTEILGVSIEPSQPPTVLVLVYKPDFPVLLAGQQPERIQITAHRTYWTPEGMQEAPPDPQE